MNCTFMIELMVVPQECSADLNYGVILSQDTMQALDLDTSIRDNTIPWGEEQISMVPHDYWTEEHILQQKACFMKQLEPPTEEIIDNEVFISEALTPVTDPRADLEQVAQNFAEADQQSSLLQVLRNHEALFLSK